MRLSDVRGELDWLGELPGRKILVKGNHDYWWSSVAKVRQELPSGAHAIQNDSVFLDGVAFGGARGWVDPKLDFRGLFPGLDRDEADPALLHEIRGGDEDTRIYRRELRRLEASLRGMPSAAELRVALLHFPPSSPGMEETEVTRLLERYRVSVVVFGHLHGTGADTVVNPYGTRSGVRYYIASADLVGFAPLRLACA